MAGHNTRSAITGDAARQDRRKFYSGLIWLALLLLLLAAGGAALFWFRSALSSRNPRFTLRKVRIQSDGYWGKTPAAREALTRQLQLEPGVSNLFRIDPGVLRGELLAIPSIGGAAVRRELPDTLAILIEERIPRAFLNAPASRYVVDGTLHVMDARQCSGVYDTLPFLTGCKDTIRPGMPPLASAKDAMALILEVNQYFPDFRLKCVDVSHPDVLRCRFLFRLGGNWLATPFNVTLRRGDFRRQLDVLRGVLAEMVRTQAPGRSIDLEYSADYGVVVK